jgi:hypothetical protein
VSPRTAAIARRAVLLAAAVVIALALSACGRKTHVTITDGENIYVNAGPLTYQVQITRELNPFATEDVQYLAGVPKAQSIPPSQLWFAVFLWAKNQSGHPQTSTDRFEIVDSSGNIYHPWPLNPALDTYAWTAQNLQPDGVEPNPDSTAAYGPTQGGEILFRLSDAVFANRPLLLRIYPPNGSKPSTVALDL